MLYEFKVMLEDRRSSSTNKRVSMESKEKLNEARVRKTLAKREESKARRTYQVKQNTLAKIAILKEQKALGPINEDEL